MLQPKLQHVEVSSAPPGAAAVVLLQHQELTERQGSLPLLLRAAVAAVAAVALPGRHGALSAGLSVCLVRPLLEEF